MLKNYVQWGKNDYQRASFPQGLANHLIAKFLFGQFSSRSQRKQTLYHKTSVISDIGRPSHGSRVASAPGHPRGGSYMEFRRSFLTTRTTWKSALQRRVKRVALNAGLKARSSTMTHAAS
jgi:hypothetical protein